MALYFVGIVVTVLIGLFIWHRHTRVRRREDFPDMIRALLILRKNGAISRLNHIGSSIWFSFERSGGSNKAAIVSLRIPRLQETIREFDEIVKNLGTNGFEVVVEENNPSLLARVPIAVDDIWDESCGARGAHAARILLAAIGLPNSAQFRLVEFGEPSRRALENKEFLAGN